MKTVALGPFQVTPICLGTMTFGEQVDEPTAHAILDRAVERDINFIDTAEMYAVPARRETYGATETIIGRWLAAARACASASCWPARWPARRAACPGCATAPDLHARPHRPGLRRQPEAAADRCIDLYQIHWPNRNAAIFGGGVLRSGQGPPFYTSIHDQLAALAKLVKAGKVRHIGLSNETPWGADASSCVWLKQHGLPRVVSVQNPYCAGQPHRRQRPGRGLHRSGVGLLAYSPLGFGSAHRQVRRPRLRPGQRRWGRIARFERCASSATSAKRRPRSGCGAGVAFTEHPYDYVDHGGTAESARQLGVPEHEVVKTLVMQDERAQPLIVLMHGDRQVSTKNLARAIGARGRALQARRGAAPQRLPGGRHVALRHRRPCRCTWQPACWRCRASASTAGGAASWSASHRRCCWAPSPSTAPSTESP
jgi:aryl-alcohol dehydrogenase-like predicted oxidoreductase